MANDVSLLWLFCTFFYIGLFTVGGGLVAITLMQQTIVDKGLISLDQFYNMIAISESTPGPVGVNMATFLGFEFYGIPGAIVTSIGEVLPSLITILIIAKIILKFRENKCVKSVFDMLRPAGTGMIFVITVNLFSTILLNIPQDISVLSVRESWKDLFDWMNITAFLVFFYVRRKFKLHPFFVVCMGAVFGLLFM